MGKIHSNHMCNHSVTAFTIEHYITQLKRMTTWINAQITTTTKTVTTVD